MNSDTAKKGSRYVEPARNHFVWTLAVLVMLGVGGCNTLEYSRVQGRFEEAVVADNAEHNPITDVAGRLYAGVAAELTAEGIAELDPKLRANAWLLRSFSEWRTGEFKAAISSAESGQNASPAAGSRDDVLLALVPALAIDASLRVERGRLKRESGSNEIDRANYDTRFKPDYETATQKVDAARKKFAAATPDSTRYYVEYQAWRIISNWRDVVTSLPVLEAGTALQEAKVGGKPLAEAAEAAKAAIPKNDGLAKLIAAQEG
jgi:hypothetical protein